MFRHLMWIIVLFNFCGDLGGPSAQAQEKKIYISLGAANVKKAVVAIQSIKPVGVPNDHPALKEVFETLRSDTDMSNLFNLFSTESQTEKADQAGVEIGSFQFTDWAPLGVEFLVKSSLSFTGDQLHFQVFLYDVFQAKLIAARKYNARVTQARSMAHAAMDDIIDSLTGEKGVFQTKISMLCKNWITPKKFISQIYVMDVDGMNMKPVTSSIYMKLFPSWSRSGRFITYTSFTPLGKRGRKQDLMIYDSKTGNSRVLFSKVGLNTGSSVWGPNDKSLLISVSQEGNRAIYSLAVTPEGYAAGPLRRVIESWGFDLEPDFSPDGKSIAFSSYRSGRPMIFVSDSEGKNPRRLTWAGHYNSAPVWSPKGDKLIFQGQDKMFGFFDLFMMSPNGTNLERLTMNQGTNENASFSPDARHIVFSSKVGNRYQIFRMNTDGGGRRQLTAPADHECMDPAWSPRF